MRRKGTANRTLIIFILLAAVGLVFVILKYSKSNTLLEKGRHHYQRGHYIAALRYFNKAIAMDKENMEAYYHRGLVRGFLGNYRGQIHDFTKAISLDPDYSDVYMKRGEVYLKLGNPARALRDFSKVIKLDPGNAVAYINRGNARFKVNRRKGACSDWRHGYSHGIKNTRHLIDAYCR